MYVKRISTKGEVEHLDWHNNYITLRSNAGIEYPGYMIHEAAMWSQAHREWIFLPRRASKEKYVCWIQLNDILIRYFFILDVILIFFQI